MQQTINLLEDMTGKYQHQQDVLKRLQEANREVQTRLERLEKGGGASSVAGGSTAPPSEPGRQPALVIGGWDPEQEARDTKQAVEDILRSVQAPISTQALFVPGIRRGYAILPVDENLGESAVRPQSADDDRGCTAWGEKDRLEAEYSSGSAWLTTGRTSVRVCSTMAARPPTAEEAGPGWVDVTAIAKALRKSTAEVSAAWGPLRSVRRSTETTAGGTPSFTTTLPAQGRGRCHLSRSFGAFPGTSEGLRRTMSYRSSRTFGGKQTFTASSL